MSGLFNKASLVLVPSGYKSGKVYSEVPTNGDGDLSFTRSNDTATRVNSAGLIEKVRTNLVTYSEEFDNASWTKSSATITANATTAPDGTTTADNLIEDTSTGQHRVFVVAGVTGSHTFSVYVKSNGRQYIALGAGNTGSFGILAYFDIENGVLGTVLAGTAKIENAGNGWYRCSISGVGNGAGTSVNIYLANSDNSNTYTGDGTSGVFVWGAQLETGDIATDYIPTTSAAVSVGMTANVPRLDYSGGGCPKLLLEPQRSNLVTFSEQLDNAAWTKANDPTITTNIATAPDGTVSADGIQSVTGGAFRNIKQVFSVSANSTVTGSVFIKKETSETAFGGLGIIFTGSTTKTCYTIFNAVTGTGLIASSTLTGTIKVDDYGNYWRLQVTTTDNGSNTSITLSYESTISTNGTTLGVGAGSVRTLWGFQLEIGATYATSYIPTLSAAVTRGADGCSKENIAGIVPTAYPFTLYAEGFLRVSNDTLIGINDLSVSDVYYSIGATTDGFFARARNSTETFVPSTTGRSVGTHKVAAVFTSSEIRLFANGALISTGANAQTFNTNATDVILGQLRVVADLGQRSSINEALVFNSALTDTQCIELTTL